VLLALLHMHEEEILQSKVSDRAHAFAGTDELLCSTKDCKNLYESIFLFHALQNAAACVAVLIACCSTCLDYEKLLCVMNQPDLIPPTDILSSLRSET
jgi:hypothetical protein